MPGINRAPSQAATASAPTASSARVQLSAVRMSGRECVFISHQKADTAFCKVIADYIISAGLDVYFDEYDKDLRLHRENGNAQGVTDCILKGITNSNYMLCVVSPNTLNSTWVPFEVGYGFEKTQLGILTLKGVTKANLPQYAQTARFIADAVPALNAFLRGRPSVINETRTFSYGGSQPVTALSADFRHPLANVMNLQ
jgi:hypothetical protein